MNFYVRTLLALKARGVLRVEDSVLVVAAGANDRASLLAAGFGNVVISNLDHHQGQTDYAPFKWMRLDAEKIELPDDSFDWVIVYAGLHHLGVPAQGVCEMFRVCRKGIACFEARDSWAMRLALKMSLTTDYELEPAFLSGGLSGGYRNGPIPNYVYRWTEREFQKVIKSFYPAFQVDFQYYYGLSVALQRLKMARSAVRRGIGILLHGISRVFPAVFPRQGNQFGMVAIKTGILQPWLKIEDGQLQFRDEVLSKKFDKEKYIRSP
jgi:ubiquinone/menaquinone biosynthesis C-methylase UbiE